MGVITQFTSRPKSETTQYKRSKITITFVPASGLWSWTVEYQVTMTFTGTCSQQELALRQAKKKVDQLEGMHE